MASIDEDAEAPEQQPPQKGRILKILGYIWSTRHTGNTKGDQKQVIQRTLRELIIYMFFLIVVCIIALGTTSSYMYYFTKVMMDLFLNENGQGTSFKKISSVTSFWDYAKGPLLNGLYWNKWYNKEKLDDIGAYIYYENTLLGVPRLRQLRVHQGTCEVYKDFQQIIDKCYGLYTDENEDKNAFGKGVNDPSNKAWSFQSSEQIDGFWHWGKLAHYGGGGYVQDLGNTKKDAETVINDLFENLWIRRGTRAVFISFTVYNANVNLFCIIRLLVEFPATGGAFPSWDFNTVNLIRHRTSFDRFLFVCEMIFAVFIFYYIIEEVIEICSEGFDYFKDVWNVVDILLIISSIVCIIFNLIRDAYVTAQLAILLDDPNKYADFTSLGFKEVINNSIFAITLFLAWVKVFKYISFNKTMTQLATTLNRCAKDLLGFFIMFFIVFLAFTQLGFLLFGTQVEDFSTFMSSFFTLFRIILGDFNFHQLELANRILGPIYFMLFVFFVFFVLINMFLAIINDTYSEVKADMSKQSDMYVMSDFIKQGYMNLVHKATRNKKTLELLEKDRDEMPGREITVAEWKKDLAERGYSADILKTVFQDMQEDRVLQEHEQSVIVDVLRKQREGETGKGTKDEKEEDIDDSLSDDEPQEFVPTEEFVGLVHRVDHMESTLGGLVHNIDTALTQLGRTVLSMCNVTMLWYPWVCD